MSDSDFRVGPGVPSPAEHPRPSDPHFWPQQSPPARPKKRRAGLLIGLGAFAAIAVLVGGGLLLWVVLDKTPVGEVAAAVTATPLESAQKHCAATSPYATIGDGGKTLTIKTVGEEEDGLPLLALECFHGELKVSDAVWSDMMATRALDGRQSGQWGDFRAVWRYHPDDGLQVIVTMD